MAEACTNDTNSVALSFNVSEELEADVRLRGIADGSITETASGIGVVPSPTAGLQATASGLGIKVAQGLGASSEGLMKVNGYSATTSPGSSPNANLNRGSYPQYGNTLTLAGSLASNALASYVLVFARWRGYWVTNLTAFGGQLQDRVDAFLQLSIDGGAWGNYDQASITRANCGGTFSLEARYGFAMANGTAHTIQSRLLVGGGTVTGSAVQGLLESEFGGTLEWIY
jgi:hypothetical protein